MKRQTSIYLSDRDFKNLDKLREVYEIDSMGNMISTLVQEKIEELRKYEILLNKD